DAQAQAASSRWPAPARPPDRGPKQQPRAPRLSGEADRLGGHQAARARRRVLHAGRPVDRHERGVQTHADGGLDRDEAPIWRCGHDAVAGSGRGYLNTPDDAYRLRSGQTTVADIRNCRIVLLSRAKRVTRILSGSCTHDPPRGFASPNGDTPLPGGGLVTEIGPPGWIDRLDARGRLVWAIRSPIAYPSDAQLLPHGTM